MGILSNILGAIFPSATAKENTAANTPAATPATPEVTTAPQPTTANTAEKVDVAAILNAKAEEKKVKLNWQTSIVDLMKLLDMDSSLTARKQLAKELAYDGDTDDSATMNIWLHKKVMEKISANGGFLPANLQTGQKVA